MTQERLANEIGTTAAVISLLERGERSLSPKWLNLLAHALKTTPGHILMHDPLSLDTQVLDVWADIPTEDRDRAIQILRAFSKKAS